MKAVSFFTPGTYMEKEDWTWDANDRVIQKLPSKGLDNIHGVDTDYDFTVYGGIEEQRMEM